MTRGHLKSFLVCFAPLSAVFIILVGFLVWDGTSVRETSLADDQRVVLGKAISTLQERIDGVVSDLLILSESTHLKAISNGADGFDPLVEEYKLFTLRRGLYDQIRFLDTQGMETVRVNYGSGVPFSVPAPDLQDKSDRPYFKLAHQAPRGTVYISGIELNEEFGEIEKPIKPVIRMSVPVFDQIGARLGVVVVNLRAEPVLAEVVAPLSINGAEPFVVDRDGNWILGGKPDENWALDLTGKARVLADRFPEAWKLMRLGLRSFETETGLYSVQLLAATDLFLARNSTRALSVIFGGEGETDSRLNLYVGTHLPQDLFEGLLWPERGMLEILSVAFFVLMALGSMAYAWTRQRQLAASFDAQLSEQVLRTSKSSVVVADENGIIAKVNPGFSAMSGYLPHEAIGQPLSFLRAQYEDAKQLGDMLMAARTNGIWEGEVRNRHKSGDFFYSNIVISAITDPSNSEVHFVEMGLDISRYMENAQELWRQANHDGLTGLANRLLFEDRLEVACGHCEAQGHMIALLYIDLDGFKPINDRYGHEIGDEVLRKVARRIKNTVRKGDTAARLGGDTFAVIVDDVKNREEAMWIAQKVTASVQRSIELGELGELGEHAALSLCVGANVGVVMFPEDTAEPNALLGLAEEKMHQQKRRRTLGQTENIQVVE